MKTRLSGFMDGELERHDEQALLDAMKCDDDLRRYWQECQLIGDVLKGECALGSDITSRVMTSLRDEPVVLAPHAWARPAWQRTALALAATVAGVAVVGWMALGPQSGQVSIPMQAAAQRDAMPAQPVRLASRDMQEYLVAHQAQSSFLNFGGGTEHIRTVVATRTTTAK